MEFNNHERLIRIFIVVVVMLLFAAMFYPFLTPLLMASLFAFAFENLISKYTQKYKSRVWVTLALVVLLCLFVVTPLIIVGFKTISSIKEATASGLQSSALYQTVEKFLGEISEKINSIAQSFDLDASELPQLGNILSKGSQSMAGWATDFVAAVPDKTLSLLVFLASLYYFLVEAPSIKKAFVQLQLLKQGELGQLIAIIQRSSYITIVASALVGALQATIVATFAYFCGYKEFMIIFVLTFLFSLIPVIGAAPVAFLLALISFLQGHNGSAIAMLVGSVIAGSIDNVVKPLIVSSSSDELHPILSLLALIGAIIIYGAPGILLGPILTQLALKVIPILLPRIENSESHHST